MGIRAIDGGVREALQARGNVEVFSEYFDFARFPAAQHAGGMVDLLRDRYADKKPDMVATVGMEALQFAIDQRKELFAGVPISYSTVEAHQLEGKPLPPDCAGVFISYDFDRTIELAMMLQPGAKEAVCVIGASEYDRQAGRHALDALGRHPALKVRVLDHTPYAEILDQVGHLPTDSMVIFTSMLRDSEGRPYVAAQVAEDLSKASSAPVYGASAHFLDRGIIGGVLTDFAAHGRALGSLVTSRLDGRPTDGRAGELTPMTVVWPALKKWNIPEKRIPPEAIVKFRPPSLWEEHPRVIMGIFAVVLVQSALIAGLLILRSTRLKAERALAESKERMSLAAEAANLGMWIWDVSGDDAWMTEKGRSLFGFKPDAHIDHAAILDRVHPDDRAGRDRAVKQALHEQGEYEMEYRVQLADGSTRWISARGRCVGGVNGRGPKLLGVSMDVTARKQAEMEFAQQREELGHLSRVALLGEMATSLAHELNQPLTAIVTNAGAARRFIERDGVDPVELKEILADIAADGRRAGEVIRGIKGMVRKVEGERRILDVNEIVAEAMRLVRPDALAHGCEVVAVPGESLPRISGDTIQLQQVLLNLVINAFDAMQGNTGQASRLEITTCSPAADMVEVSVRDFGPGLPVGASTQVFERFYSTKREGMGMGLAIARSIIEAHSGTMGAENADGGGARFWFRLPAWPAEMKEVEP